MTTASFALDPDPQMYRSCFADVSQTFRTDVLTVAADYQSSADSRNLLYHHPLLTFSVSENIRTGRGFCLINYYYSVTEQRSVSRARLRSSTARRHVPDSSGVATAAATRIERRHGRRSREH